MYQANYFVYFKNSRIGIRLYRYFIAFRVPCWHSHILHIRFWGGGSWVQGSSGDIPGAVSLRTQLLAGSKPYNFDGRNGGATKPGLWDRNSVRQLRWATCRNAVASLIRIHWHLGLGYSYVATGSLNCSSLLLGIGCEREGEREGEAALGVGAKSAANMWVMPTITLKVGGPLFLEPVYSYQRQMLRKLRTERNSQLSLALFLRFAQSHIVSIAVMLNSLWL